MSKNFRSIFGIITLCTALLVPCTMLQGQQPSANEVIQRETVRRQEIVLRSAQDVREAEVMVNAGQFTEARAKLMAILETSPNQGDGAAIIARANELLAFMDIREAEVAREKGEWFEVRDKAISALTNDPGNKRAGDLLAGANRALGIDNNDINTLNPAISPRFIDDLANIKQLLKEGQDLFGTGQIDEAEKKYLLVLNVDPYNKQAASLLRTVYRERKKAAEIARKSSRQEYLTTVAENWTQRVKTDFTLPAGGEASPMRRSNDFTINSKLNTIIIPEVNFEDATIADAARFLTSRTRDLDPDGQGVSFLLRNEALLRQASPFTLRLRNVPVGELLRYITNLAGVRFRVEEFAVFIVPVTERTDVLITRDFPVPASFFDVAPAASAAPVGGGFFTQTAAVARPTGTDAIRDALVSRGVSFPEGATAFYNRGTGILTVRNTQDQIDLVEELVTGEQGDALIVHIEAKFVEINQRDLDALTPNILLQGRYAYGPGAGNNAFAAGTVGVDTNLQGASRITERDGINRIINLTPEQGSAANPAGIVPIGTDFQWRGMLDGQGFQAMLTAISQKTSADLMSAPSILVNDGETGSITVAREFSYPIDYDQPVTAGGLTFSGGANAIIFQAVPAFPREYEERNVGVALTVQPRITVDRQRVFLTLKPEVVEFDGFINYGTPIFVPDDGAIGNQNVLTNNIINMPVFSVRTVEDAKLEIQDGYTMVLGGLIREDINTVEDKVPFLGDIPLIGRAFRSKAEQSIKRNLLIFVTVRILRPDGEPLNVAQPVAMTP